MTNQEAIKYLIKPVSTSTSDGEEKQKEFEAYKMAIEALEKLPCDPCLMSDKKLEECNDAISRQAAISIIQNWLNNDTGYSWGEKNVMKCAISELEDLPSVTPQQKTGHWITKVKSDLRGDMWPSNPKCSICGKEPYYSNTIYNYNFCPYCGAKMEVEK